MDKWDIKMYKWTQQQNCKPKGKYIINYNNINELNAISKGHFIYKDTDKLKIKGWKIYHANTNSNNKVVMVILMSDKVLFNARSITGDKEAHFIIIKESIQMEATIPHSVKLKKKTYFFLNSNFCRWGI